MLSLSIVSYNNITKLTFIRLSKSNGNRNGDVTWSGEATRNQGLKVDPANVKVSIGSDAEEEKPVAAKEKPIWMTESTIISPENNIFMLDDELSSIQNTNSQTNNTNEPANSGSANNLPSTSSTSSTSSRRRDQEDIMAMLLQCETPSCENTSTRQAKNTSDIDDTDDISLESCKLHNTKSYHHFLISVQCLLFLGYL